MPAIKKVITYGTFDFWKEPRLFGNCLRVTISDKKYMQQFVEALVEIDVV